MYTGLGIFKNGATLTLQCLLILKYCSLFKLNVLDILKCLYEAQTSVAKDLEIEKIKINADKMKNKR